MTLKIIAGKLIPAMLNSWLISDDFNACLSDINKTSSIHCLIEYVHRYVFNDINGFIEDIQRGEITKYCLRGRIFWEYGQIQWRRLSESEMALLIITDDAEWNILPKGITNTRDNIDSEITAYRDRNIILWGTYSPAKKAYLELRVSGSKPIDYPQQIIKHGKDYPILNVREYLDKRGRVSLWRFKGITSKNAVELTFKESL